MLFNSDYFCTYTEEDAKTYFGQWIKPGWNVSEHDTIYVKVEFDRWVCYVWNRVGIIEDFKTILGTPVNYVK